MVLVSVYDRGRAGEGFLGMLQIKPVLKDGYTIDQWYKLGNRGDEVVTGEIWIQMTFTAIRVGICCVREAVAVLTPPEQGSPQAYRL